MATLWIGFCVAAGLWLGFSAAHNRYCLRDNENVCKYEPLTDREQLEISTNPDLWESTQIPPQMVWRVPGFGALLGVIGAALFYGIGAVVAWVVRGFRGG